MVLDPIDYHSMNMEVNGTRNCFCSKISDLQCFYIVQNLRLKLNSCILRSDLDKLLIYKTHPSFWFLHDTCPSFSVIFLLISGRVTLIQGYFDLHCKAELALYKNDSRDISVKNLTNDAVRLRQTTGQSGRYLSFSDEAVIYIQTLKMLLSGLYIMYPEWKKHQQNLQHLSLNWKEQVHV